MTSGREWLDIEAEKKFWALMQEYETLQAEGPGSRRGLALLIRAPFRNRRLRERMERIETEAQELVARFSVTSAPAPAKHEPPQDDTHPLLRIAATLANDVRSRERGADAVNASAAD